MPVFDTDSIVGASVQLLEIDQTTLFRETESVLAVFEFTFEDIHGNEHIELNAVRVDVPPITEPEQ